jgi:polar amino acid transport system substrate-binding protein
MFSMRRTRPLAALMAAAALMVTSLSCSAADLMASVKAKKEIVVATEAQFAPFEFVQDGKIVGYGPDLMHTIMAGMPGVAVKQMDLPFQGILPGLAGKRFDFVITSVVVTKERNDKFAFTVPIADATVALVKRANDKSIAQLTDISGKVVGSQAGSGQLKALQDYDRQLKASGKPGVKAIREYVSFDEAYADLAAGRIDAVAQSLSNLAPLVKARGDTFAVLKQPLGPKTYFAWAGRKDADSASLVKFFSDGINRAKKSGKLKELQMKWFGFTMDLPDTLPAPEL